MAELCEAKISADTVAMTKRLSATDPEPPIGSIVLDDIGQRWVRFDVDGRCWAQIEADGSPVDDDTESWIKVAGNYGPVLLIDGDEISLCPSCHCMTKRTANGCCGKCGA